VTILGIDPGSRYTGYGLVARDGRDLVHVASGRINATVEDDFGARLPVIYDGLCHVLERFEPESAAIEGIFTAYNSQSTIKLGHARGVAVLALQHAGLNPADYPPAEVKKTVAGHGRADKRQIQEMVKLRLGLEGQLAEDAADALAVAICHAQTRSLDEYVR
jgi:crossover junction endodeoxyribonuclease RuvC